MKFQFQPLQTSRFLLRKLTEEDATFRYANWFENASVKSFIKWRPEKNVVQELRDYIRNKNAASDTLMLGIFEANSNIHIGNIKYDFIDLQKKHAVMGILIGDEAWRGKKVSAEVISATSCWLKEFLHINEIWLGVEKSNTAAVAAYEKIGFKKEDTQIFPHDSVTTDSMVWRI